MISALYGTTTDLMAQDLRTIQTAQTPLTLHARGSFFIGGNPVEQTFVELGSRRPADRVTVNQMYVEYMVPAGTDGTPVIMVHGASLSGNSFDTTPDGRMGWYEYFVRKTHPVYVVDQVGRGRSGFNQALFNNAGAGLVSAAEQPRMTRMGDRFGAWVNFRIGPQFGHAFADSKYPVAAIDELSRQGIPDLDATLPTPNPNYLALANLAGQLSGAVVLGHSQSGAYPLQAALMNPAAVKAMVLVEPGSCSAGSWTDEQINTLARIPLLVVYGDHLEASTYLPGPGWQDRFDECLRLLGRLKKAGGHADMLHPPQLGIHGNSHMIMQDTNNLQIADLILQWLQQQGLDSSGPTKTE